jgi:hypothetical protein
MSTDVGPQAGDTIAFKPDSSRATYRIARIVEVRADDRYRARQFEFPGKLNEKVEDLRIGAPVDLRQFLPTHEGDDMLAGDYIVAAGPNGVRIGKLVHNFNSSEPALLVRDDGNFNFRFRRSPARRSPALQ